MQKNKMCVTRCPFEVLVYIMILSWNSAAVGVDVAKKKEEIEAVPTSAGLLRYLVDAEET